MLGSWMAAAGDLEITCDDVENTGFIAAIWALLAIAAFALLRRPSEARPSQQE
jgi:hypothetical protein